MNQLKNIELWTETNFPNNQLEEMFKSPPAEVTRGKKVFTKATRTGKINTRYYNVRDIQ